MSTDTLDSSDDTELVRAAQAGSRAAFAELVNRYKVLVFATASARARTAHESQEIAHEAFVVAWRQLARLRGPDRFRGWIYRITRTVQRQRWREQGRWRGRESGSVRPGVALASDDPSPLDRAIAHEEERLLWQALRELPERYRLPLMLHYCEQRPIDRVAETLGLTVRTAAKYLSLGRRMLRDRISPAEPRLACLRVPDGAFTAAIVAAIASEAAGAQAATAGRARRFSAGQALLVGGPCLLVSFTLLLALVLRGGGGRPSGAHATGSGASAHPGAAPVFVAQPVAGGADERLVGTASATEPAGFVERGRDLIKLDFESGLQPPDLNFGQVVPGPARAGNRYSVISGLSTYNDAYYVGLQAPPGSDGTLFRYSETMTVRFDYWLGEPVMLTFLIWDPDKLHNYVVRLRGLPAGQWGHVEVRLGDVVPHREKAPPIEAGDRIGSFLVGGGRAGGLPFYIDNLVVSAAE